MSLHLIQTQVRQQNCTILASNSGMITSASTLMRHSQNLAPQGAQRLSFSASMKLAA